MRRNGLHTSAVIVFSLLALCCLLPMLLLFSASITDNNTIILNGYRFIPEQTSLAAYRYLWSNRVSILHSYLVSIGVTLVGTAFGDDDTSGESRMPLSQRKLGWWCDVDSGTCNRYPGGRK